MSKKHKLFLSGKKPDVADEIAPVDDARVFMPIEIKACKNGYCHVAIPRDAEECPHCGYPQA